MLEIFCFDIGAVLILATMILTILFRRITRGRINHVFIQLVCVTLAAGIFDIVSNAYNGVLSVPEIIKYAITGCYYIFTVMAFFLYARYVLDLTDTRHLFNRRFYRHLTGVPVLCAVALTIITYFTHICYYYSPDGRYTRGGYNIIFYIICGGYALYATVKALKHFRFFGITKTCSLVTVALFSCITAYIQYEYPYVVVTILGISCSLLFIMLFINNAEEKIDAVTGLKNYQAYVSDMKRAYDIEKPVSIIYINVMNFPEIEGMISFDNFIELAGKVSKIVIGIESRYKTRGDLYYLRNGRFRIVILDYFVSAEKLEEMAVSLYSDLNCDITVSETSVTINTNVCIANAQDDFSSYEELAGFGGVLAQEQHRDYIMYASKLLKNDKYDIVTKLDTIMERGIQNHAFEVYYQPIYSLKEKRYTHAEALLRLYDEEFGLIPPEIIISAAESNGVIHRLGRIVLRDVCRFISSDAFKELNLTAIAVNVSVIQLMQRSFADEFISTMQEFGVRSDQLILEFTESDATENQKSVVDNIETIAKNGTKFSLNNYGTGYSNITTSSSLPLASSKLDRTIVNGEQNEKLEVIIDNSVRLLKSLNRTIVVVGIENEETLHKYEALDVDYLQGFYFREPVPLEDFCSFIKENNK